MGATRVSSTGRRVGVLAALLLGAVAGTARAETVRCIDVNALPAGPNGSRTITSPGAYCLTANLSYTGRPATLLPSMRPTSSSTSTASPWMAASLA